MTGENANSSFICANTVVVALNISSAVAERIQSNVSLEFTADAHAGTAATKPCQSCSRSDAFRSGRVAAEPDSKIYYIMMLDSGFE